MNEGIVRSKKRENGEEEEIGKKRNKENREERDKNK